MGFKCYVIGDLVDEKEEDINQRLESIPVELENTDIKNLRWNGTEIVDANNESTFYIDENGIKHLLNIGDWQELECNFKDELKMVDGVWVAKTDQEVLDDLRKKTILEIKDHISGFMLENSRYPDRYRESPEYSFSRNYMIAQGWFTSDEIFSLMYKSGRDVFDGEDTISGIVENFDEEKRMYIREVIQEGVIQIWFGDIRKLQLDIISTIEKSEFEEPFNIFDLKLPEYPIDKINS